MQECRRIGQRRTDPSQVSEKVLLATVVHDPAPRKKFKGSARKRAGREAVNHVLGRNIAQGTKFQV